MRALGPAPGALSFWREPLNTLRDRIGRQLDLEAEARALGVERYRRQRPLPWRTDTAGVEDEADLPPGRQLLKLTIEPVASALHEFIQRVAHGGAGRRPAAAKILGLGRPEEVAYLIGRVVVSSAAVQLSAQATAFQVADAIIDHAEMLRLKDANKEGFKGLLKSQQRSGYSGKKRKAVRKIMENEGAKLDFSLTDRLHAGMKAIELFCDATGLFVLDLQQNARGEAYVVRPTETARVWLERQHARCEVLEPVHLPMVVRPRRWRSPFWGGYLTKRPGLRLAKQWNWRYHEELRHVDMEPVYRAVNNVQNTAWRINRRVLDVMTQVWDGGGSLGGLPRRDDLPLPPKPVDFETNETAAKEWKAEAAAVHQKNAQTLSRRLAMSQRLWIAAKFADEEAIYFPHELDFRGRIYPIPTGGPHPQGEDSAKALLEFSEGVPLGEEGPMWLAIHLANLFGVDKVSFADRLAWVEQHMDLILDSARNPLDGERFWATADSPYCALAACFEWDGYVREGVDYVSHIPVALDGSNSGLQHFSAMLRDPIGAEAVNLLPCGAPQDIYARVAKRAQEIADATPIIEIEVGGEKVSFPNPWVGGKVTRKIAKRPCMTFCYSATRFGMQGMIVQTLRELDMENAEAGKPPHLEGADNYRAAIWLSHVLWQVISETVNAASAAMEWLRTAAKVAAEYGLPIWWTTPMGFPVLQAYRSVNAKRVDVYCKGKRLTVTLSIDTEEIDKRGQANGIAPNFVHSLDAAHLMAVVNRMADLGVTHMALIHDSFGTHAANAGLLSRELRRTFIEQYTPNVLARFRDELVAQLPDELVVKLPPLPRLGPLDLGQLEFAEYMFA
ncbi:DNA-directed RNA polymerase [Phenylobacterium sp.]|uniref:DNA-directed RNA polymerase n=1 Tax=Phenylobacterium sp. TaxID=1871053 RepID=UPI00392241FC